LLVAIIGNNFYSPGNMRNLAELSALQGFKEVILKHHERFTDKTLNHITYIDKELWDSPDDALKQKILNDAKKNNNKVIVD
jgi:hypothetical protein